jgi:hypothetical protein
MRHRAMIAAGAGVFVMVLGYLTLLSAPARPPTGIDHNAASAEASCRTAIGEQVADARFPFSGTAIYLGEARYRLQGTVEVPQAGEIVRRIYECVVSYTETGSYRPDSVTVWQSH